MNTQDVEMFFEMMLEHGYAVCGDQPQVSVPKKKAPKKTEDVLALLPQGWHVPVNQTGPGMSVVRHLRFGGKVRLELEVLAFRSGRMHVRKKWKGFARHDDPRPAWKDKARLLEVMAVMRRFYA